MKFRHLVGGKLIAQPNRCLAQATPYAERISTLSCCVHCMLYVRLRTTDCSVLTCMVRMQFHATVASVSYTHLTLPTTPYV